MDGGQTDMTKAAVAFRNFVDTQKKKISSKGHIYFTAHTATFLAEVGNILACKFVTPSFHWLPLLDKDLGTGAFSFTIQLPSSSRKAPQPTTLQSAWAPYFLCILIPRRWRQQIPLKCRYLYAVPNGITL
jgi:hypothetical protein